VSCSSFVSALSAQQAVAANEKGRCDIVVQMMEAGGGVEQVLSSVSEWLQVGHVARAKVSAKSFAIACSNEQKPLDRVTSASKHTHRGLTHLTHWSPINK
jgi:hypothetical protein